MIKEIIKNNKKVFMCEECCLTYKDKKWAEKCEAWCKKHNSCNLKITSYAIKKSLCFSFGFLDAQDARFKNKHLDINKGEQK